MLYNSGWGIAFLEAFVGTWGIISFFDLEIFQLFNFSLAPSWLVLITLLLYPSRPGSPS